MCLLEVQILVEVNVGRYDRMEVYSYFLVCTVDPTNSRWEYSQTVPTKPFNYKWSSSTQAGKKLIQDKS